MTDLAKSLRDKLATRAEVRAPAIISDHTSTDGTRKWLVDVGNGNAWKPCSFRKKTAAPCASRPRPAAP